VVLVAFRNTPSEQRKLLWFYFFLATASHGLLDAMTDGGLGVAFFSPFATTRYFLPWRPILVSPIGVTRFFSPRGLAVLRGEIFWIWLPAAILAFCSYVFHRFRGPRANE
jgi:inner membrane protein